MEQSILKSIKKTLGLPEGYDVFDQDVIMHINSVFGTLNQLGIGPQDGFMIEDETATWDDFLSNTKVLNAAKSYIYMQVRLLFDPPSTGYLVSAYQAKSTELEWRLNAAREEALGSTPESTSTGIVFDGGAP